MSRLSWFLLLTLTLAGAADAGIYTWTDAAGVRHFSDVAASRGAKRADLPPSGDGDASGALHAPRTRRAARGAAADARRPVLTRPKQGATVRSAGGTVAVALTVGGGAKLRDGERVIYYLDGRPLRQSPTTRTSLRLTGVADGAHTLSAALRYRGHEIRRTADLTFDVKPPAAGSRRGAGRGDRQNGAGVDTQNPLGAPVAVSRSQTARAGSPRR